MAAPSDQAWTAASRPEKTTVPVVMLGAVSSAAYSGERGWRAACAHVSRAGRAQEVDIPAIDGIDVTKDESGEQLIAGVREKLGDGKTLDYVICVAG